MSQKKQCARYDGYEESDSLSYQYMEFMTNHVMNLVLHCLTVTRDPYMCRPPTPHFPALIVFSGTQNAKDLLVDDFDIRRAKWPQSGQPRGHVHKGFARRTSVLLERMKLFTASHDDFVIAGHSLGGACAVLAASDLTRSGKRVRSVYTFGSPRMATPEFRSVYTHEQSLSAVSYHFATPNDPIIHRIPYIFDSIGCYEPLPFHDVSDWVHHDIRSYNAALQAKDG